MLVKSLCYSNPGWRHCLGIFAALLDVLSVATDDRKLDWRVPSAKELFGASGYLDPRG